MATGNEPGADTATLAISRIVVTFAGAVGDRTLIEAAALAARALRAELHGLYIRDQTLRDLAALPFSAVVGPGGIKAGDLTVEAVERAWHREEQSCRRVLQEAGVVSTFHTVSGEFESCLCATANRRDLVALAGQPAQMTPWDLAATVRAAVRTATAVMIPAAALHGRLPGHRARKTPGPVLAIDDGDIPAMKARALAGRLAEAAGRPLAVLRVGGSAPAWLGAGEDATGPRGADLHQLPLWSESGLAAAVDRIGPSLVVADLNSPGLSQTALADRFIRSVRAPLILLASDRDPEAD